MGVLAAIVVRAVICRLRVYMLPQLAARIQQAQSLILTTHKQCDGDGLGAALALYHALKKQGKTPRLLTIDGVPKKYDFLQHHRYAQNYTAQHDPIEATDLALVFDTNDCRLIEPLYSELQKKCHDILFVDHHPPLNDGPRPTPGSHIDTQAASTGEVVFQLIQKLGVEFDSDIAQALYTSIVFDTQVFRYIKNSPRSLQIGGQLLQWLKKPEDIHRALFATYTPDSLSYLGKMLHQVQYSQNNRIAMVDLRLQDLADYKLKAEDVKDVIDMMILVACVECAAVLREEAHGVWKLSLRTRNISALKIAERFGGGGHQHAAGALLKGELHALQQQVKACIQQQLV